jgi:hypothetical protein
LTLDGVAVSAADGIPLTPGEHAVRLVIRAPDATRAEPRAGVTPGQAPIARQRG